MKKQKIIYFVLSMLLVFTTACGPEKPITPVTTVPTSTESTSSPTSFAEQTTTHPTSTTNTSLTTSVTEETTTTQTQKPETTTQPVSGDAVTVLPKKFSDYDSKTKDFLVSCGLTEKMLDVNKQKLTCTEKGKQYAPLYETYEGEHAQYTFYDINGLLTAFTRKELPPMGAEKSEASILAIARQLAGLYIPISEYREKVSVYEDEYVVSYWWDVGKYETLRRVTINIRKDGVARRIQVQKLDVLQDVSIPQIDEDALYRECDTVLKKTYQGDYVSFEIRDKLLDVKDGQLLAYYQWQPEIKNGEVVLLCNCAPLLEDGIKGRLRWVAVPLSKIRV